MEQNINLVVQMTNARTAAQTLAAVHDDRTAQPYSVLNGLGPLTSYFMTGIGSSITGTAPTSLTATSYMAPTSPGDILRTTALPSGYALFDGNSYDGWGQLNYYAAANGYGAFNSAVSVTMDAAAGGYHAFDI